MVPLTIHVDVDGDDITLVDCPISSVESFNTFRKTRFISYHEKNHYWAQHNLLFVRCSSESWSSKIELKNVSRMTKEPLKRAGWVIKREDSDGMLHLSWDASEVIGHILSAGTSRLLLPMALVITDRTAISLWAIRDYLKVHGQSLFESIIDISRLSAYTAYPAPVRPSEVSLPSFISNGISKDSLSIDEVLSKLLARCEVNQIKGLQELRSLVSCGLVSPLCRGNANNYRTTLQDTVTSSGGMHALFNLVESCKDTQRSNIVTLALEGILRLLENNNGKTCQIIRHVDCFPVLLSALERFHHCSIIASLTLRITHMLIFKLDVPVDGVLSRPFTLEVLRATRVLSDPLDVIMALDILIELSKGGSGCPEALRSLLTLQASWRHQPSEHPPILADRLIQLIQLALYKLTSHALVYR